jgi:biotin synthase
LPPPVDVYRRVQLARYLIVHGKAQLVDMQFDGDGRITGFGLSKETLEPIIEEGAAFRTSGCPDCNRPYYNEKPSGPIYNYPKHPSQEEVKEIKKQLRN